MTPLKLPRRKRAMMKNTNIFHFTEVEHYRITKRPLKIRILVATNLSIRFKAHLESVMPIGCELRNGLF